jgi:hypothetical protein
MSALQSTVNTTEIRRQHSAIPDERFCRGVDSELQARCRNPGLAINDLAPRPPSHLCHHTTGGGAALGYSPDLNVPSRQLIHSGAKSLLENVS